RGRPPFPTRRSSDLMCAAIPMFRVRSSGNLRSGEFGLFAATVFFSRVAVAIKLPAEMRKGPVGLRHFVRVLAFLDRVALTGGGRSEEHTSELQSLRH